MKVSKRQLRRIIREEKARLAETGCAVEGMGHDDLGGAPAMAATPVMAESSAPEAAMLSEMANAVQALEQVAESVEAAADLCHDCAPAVAMQAPLMEAAVAQVQALQETLQAQAEVVAESADVGAAAPAAEAPMMAAVHDLVS
jgi:hypothetical protein